MIPAPFVIIGAGQVAATAVEALRREGYKGRLIIIGDEPQLPYQRPPLSKKFLAGELQLDRLLVKPLIAERAHFDLNKLENQAVGLREAVA